MVIRQLIEHLEREIALYKELITALQKETENLVNRDYKGLYDTVNHKEHILVRIDSIGPSRIYLIQEAAKAIGIKDRPSLSLIVERIESGASVELERCRRTAISLIESIQEINSLNSIVVKGSLDNINKTLGLLGNFLPSGVYTSNGAFGSINLKGYQLSEGI
ncbi:MAG: flagellar protein FlgN [Deltaproteobacteria bacterium]|nr:flagellar protein FlgN [Deltaproteobacteria bacterium]